MPHRGVWGIVVLDHYGPECPVRVGGEAESGVLGVGHEGIHDVVVEPDLPTHAWPFVLGFDPFVVGSVASVCPARYASA